MLSVGGPLSTLEEVLSTSFGEEVCIAARARRSCPVTRPRGLSLPGRWYRIPPFGGFVGSTVAAVGGVMDKPNFRFWHK
jgi:hypothetical protein